MKKLLFLLLRYAVCENVTIENKQETEDNLTEIYKLAKKHDLGQAVAFAAEKLGIKKDFLEREKALAILRVEKLKFATEQVSDILEKAKIPHMLLKGAHLRCLYPEEWVRTSCDVDIYVERSQSDFASELLEKNGFIRGRYGEHDIALTAPNGCHIELHFLLMEEKWLKNSSKIFSDIWRKSVKETEYRYRMNDEMLRFYHIAHMSKHIRNGGCGIKPFLDIWMIDTAMHQHCKDESLYEKAGLVQLERNAKLLTQIWFSDEKHTPLTSALEEYILSGNVYGTHRNTLTVKRRESGNKFNYICSRLFMPYSELSKKYPSLKRCPLLYPIYMLRRWFTLFNKKVSRRVKSEIAIEKNDINSVDSLLSGLGL